MTSLSKNFSFRLSKGKRPKRGVSRKHWSLPGTSLRGKSRSSDLVPCRTLYNTTTRCYKELQSRHCGKFSRSRMAERSFCKSSESRVRSSRETRFSIVVSIYIVVHNLQLFTFYSSLSFLILFLRYILYCKSTVLHLTMFIITLYNLKAYFK